ncbi:hypothetical protein C1646_762834 [Rhizophagus diaphanus]|nr:hypothetical protein C1646_762834 [Rhizophagus diaphanus] [Rhizophagus sp. MUCL 43196]
MDSTQTNIMNHFKSDEPLPLAEQNSLDQAVLKAWVAAGIPFSDFSQNSTTGDFLADQVSSIIEKVGLEKFAAFVTDSGSNCH